MERILCLEGQPSLISLKSKLSGISSSLRIISYLPKARIYYFTKIVKSYFNNYIIIVTRDRQLYCQSINIEYNKLPESDDSTLTYDDFIGFELNREVDLEDEYNRLSISCSSTFQFTCYYSITEGDLGFLTAANFIRNSIWLGFASGFVLFAQLDFNALTLHFRIPHGAEHTSELKRDLLVLEFYEPLRHTQTVSQILCVDNAIWTFSYDKSILIWK